jgi:H+-transporting ATPase
MSLAILVFNFYPVTAVMIVMLALLNDGAILSIAYDNVQYRKKPEAWNMRVVLGIASVLGVTGVIAVFILFFLAERVFHIDHARVQTLMYLKLSIAGHLTIFLTRTRGPFWSIRPAKILCLAVLGTQALATLIAVYGLFMTPLGWRWAACVWGYALVWALVNDRVKLAAYWVLDRADARRAAKHKGESKHDAKADAKPTPAADARPPDAKPDAKPDAADAKPDPKTEAKPDAKTEAKPAAAPEAKPDRKADVKPAAAADAKPNAKPEPAAAPEAKPDPKADAKPAAAADAKPQPEANGAAGGRATSELVERVHELYEELGREDVRAVEDWDKKHKAAPGNRGDGRT